MSINWREGIEGEASSALRARAESIEDLQKLQSRLKWFYVLPALNSVLLLLNLFFVITDFNWVTLGAVFLLVFAIKLSLYSLRVRRSQIEAAHQRVDDRQKSWDAVCARLARGEQ